MQRLRVKIWVASPRGDFGAGHVQIMHQIARTGSILGASEAMGLSYKKTWSKKTELAGLLGGEIFISQSGRSERSGTRLSERAEAIAAAFEQLDAEVKDFAERRFAELLAPLLGE